MIINDSTFLLDESLSNLKKIHDLELLISDERSFSQLSQDEQKAKRDALNEATRGVRSWLLLGSETLDMFIRLTEDAPAPFYQPVLGDRVASMLNYNIIQLCGPKCTSLKVKDAQRFHWAPRKTLEQLVDIYKNLSCSKFAEYLAYDEVLYRSRRFLYLAIIHTRDLSNGR